MSIACEGMQGWQVLCLIMKHKIKGKTHGLVTHVVSIRGKKIQQQPEKRMWQLGDKQKTSFKVERRDEKET